MEERLGDFVVHKSERALLAGVLDQWLNEIEGFVSPKDQKHSAVDDLLSRLIHQMEEHP